MTYIDPNFRLTKTMFDWGQAEGLTINLSKSTVRFREYHQEVQTKTEDWFGLWKKWVTSEEQRFAGQPGYHGVYYAHPDPEPDCYDGISTPMPDYLRRQIAQMKVSSYV